MVALLDVNVLVALFDPVHTHHEAAHQWFSQNRKAGWATSPITENGLVRVLSNPSYPGRRTTVRDAISRLVAFRESGDHSFWPDSATLCDRLLIHPTHLLGHKQLTDVYLLALAVKNGGCVATFDRSIPLASVAGAGKRHLAVLGAPRPGDGSPRKRAQDE